MDLVIFTDNKNIKKAFSSIEKSKSADLVFISCNSIRKDIKNMCKKDLIYIDVSGFTKKEISSFLTFLSKQENNSFGILDPGNQIEDIAGLFFQNITDYFGKELLKSNISLPRIKKALEFRNINEEEENIKINEAFIPVNDWTEIKSGKEYTFTFLYIGIDNTDILKQRFSSDILTKMQNNLRLADIAQK